MSRLLVNKPCLGLLVLLTVPIVVLLLLDGSSAFTNFIGTPEQLKLLAEGFLQQQRYKRLGDDVAGLVCPADPAYDNHTRKKECNYAKGRWVADQTRPLYSGNECKQWLSLVWNCRRMERTDFSYESYRWQPHGCDMPEFTGPNFLERMRHKTLSFVGDSLGRQQFQSMMCIASGGRYSPEVEDVGWRYGLVKAPAAFSPGGCAYRFPETNTTVLFFWSATLSELEPLNTTSYALHLDRPLTFLKEHLRSFDTLVLNTGHHWNKVKFSRNRWELYAGRKPVGGAAAEFSRARNLKLRSIARWLDSELQHFPHIKVFLRTMSPSHFVDGEWNTGGRCEDATPLSSGSEVLQDHSSDLSAEHAVKGTRVRLLDITSISELRGEGHISNHSIGAQRAIYDCLHWCLPGVPDMWNELLFAQI